MLAARAALVLALLAAQAASAQVVMTPVDQDRRARLLAYCDPDEIGFPFDGSCVEEEQAAADFGDFVAFLDAAYSDGGLGLPPVPGPVFDGCATVENEQWTIVQSSIEPTRYRAYGAVWVCGTGATPFFDEFETEARTDFTFDVNGATQYRIGLERRAFPFVFCFHGSCSTQAVAQDFVLERISPDPTVLFDADVDCLRFGDCVRRTTGSLLPGRYRVRAGSAFAGLPLPFGDLGGHYDLELEIGPGLHPGPAVPALPPWGFLVAALGLVGWARRGAIRRRRDPAVAEQNVSGWNRTPPSAAPHSGRR